jgi:hypothetical protein
VAEQEETEPRRINWGWVLLWTCIGILLLVAASAFEAAWKWAGVTIETLVHVGATLLLAPLLPFLEKGLTRRVTQANRQMIREETAGLQQQVESLATRLDQLQGNVDVQDAEKVQDQDRIIEVLKDEVSFLAVARAMTVANKIGALPDGEITVHASSEPMIDVAFSWQFHMGDGRFGVSSGFFLGVSAKVESDPGGGTPVIETIWRSTERAEEVITRINELLQQRDRWKGQGTIDWPQVFRDLHQGIVIAVAYKRRDTTVAWQLHGGLYEIRDGDWAITEAGIESRASSAVVLAETGFPESTERPRFLSPTNLGEWAPSAPDGTDSLAWQQLLWRGLMHLPIDHGPVRGQPTRYPWKAMPEA